MRMMTTNEAAERLGCKPVTIRKAITQGRLTAQKFGRDWIIIEDTKFQQFVLGSPGRPPKVTTHDEAATTPTRKTRRGKSSTPRSAEGR